MEENTKIYQLEKRIKELEEENRRYKTAAPPLERGLHTPLDEAREQLRDIQERFKRLVDLLPQTVWETDERGVFTFVNRYTEVEFGYAMDEVVGKLSIFDVISSADKLVLTEKFKTGSLVVNVGREIMLVRKDGSRFYGLVHYTTVIRNGKLQGIQGFITNIENQKSAQAKLQESNEQVRAILEALPDIMFIFSRDGLFVDCHVPADAQLYTTPDQFIGRNVHDAVPTYLADLTQSKLNTLFELNQTQVYSYSIELNGLPRHYDARMVALGTDKALTIVRDVTDRVVAEEALRQSEENYHTIFQLANDSIIIHDPLTNEIVDANRVAIESYGLKTIVELRNYGYWNESPYGLAEARAWNLKALNEGPQVFDWKNRRADGTFFWEEVHLTAIKILGEERIISICRDITIRKSIEDKLQAINRKLKERNEEYAALNEEYVAQNEELQKAIQKAFEADKLKSAFLANMSHEIRTPMNAIMGFSSLIGRGNLPEDKLKTFSQIIQKRSSDLLKIIDDILDISKIEANQLVIKRTVGNLRELMNDVFEYSLTKAEIDSKTDVKLSLVNQTGEASTLNTDFGRVKQVLFNLIENALKFTNKGRIEIGCQNHDDGKLLFWVSDTGPGVTKENQQRIFERFQQAHTSLDPNFGGTGLGLAISKGIITLLEGDIWVESQVGQGATFYFTIPIGHGEATPLPKKQKDNSTVADITCSILVVEDDAVNASFINEVLSETGATLWFASTGADALEVASNQPYIDLVLLDIRLPDCSGLDLIDGLKQRLPRAKIIIQSAYATSEDRMVGRTKGSDHYITKPIDPNEMIETIVKVLSS